MCMCMCTCTCACFLTAERVNKEVQREHPSGVRRNAHFAELGQSSFLTRNHQNAAAGALRRTFAICEYLRTFFIRQSRFWHSRLTTRCNIPTTGARHRFLSQFACAIPASVIPSHSRRRHVPVCHVLVCHVSALFGAGKCQHHAPLRAPIKAVPTQPRGENKPYHLCGQSHGASKHTKHTLVCV